MVTGRNIPRGTTATRRAPEQRLTIAEVASAAGVSIPTVSKVLNNRSDVSAETRARVERVVEESGYVRNRAARVLRKGASGLIDLVAPELHTDYDLAIVRGVETALEQSGIRLVLSATHDETRSERSWLGRVLDKSTDGALLVLPREESGWLEELQLHHIPFVVIDDRSALTSAVPSVSSTNWAGGFTATEYLLSLGHRRIAALTGTTSFISSRARLAGYRAAMDMAGVPIRPEFICEGDFTSDSAFHIGRSQTHALLSLPHPPTAIVAANDYQAMGIYRALYELSLKAPDDMSVIGYDDLHFARFLSPALTTIRQPLAEMGGMAAGMLLRLIAGKPLESARVELATSLIVRGSCAAPVDASGKRQASVRQASGEERW